MNPDVFAYWMTVNMVLNIVAFGWFAWSFLRWRVMAERRWVRRMFLIASLLSLLMVAGRIVGLLMFENLTVRFVFVTYFSIGSLFMAAMFSLATSVMKRRIRERPIHTMAASNAPDYNVVGFAKGATSPKASDMADEIICELRGKVEKRSKYKTARI